jgi:broad specificity polyphosphatase/5'/3'-nucleotidase SurE
MSPLGDTYYWAAGHGLDFHATEEGSDVDLLMKHQITVTPLKFDLTRHDRMGKWRETLG